MSCPFFRPMWVTLWWPLWALALEVGSWQTLGTGAETDFGAGAGGAAVQPLEQGQSRQL